MYQEPLFLCSRCTLAANVATAGIDESSARNGHLFLATKDASIVGIQLGTHSGKLASVWGIVI